MDRTTPLNDLLPKASATHETRSMRSLSYRGTLHASRRVPVPGPHALRELSRGRRLHRRNGMGCVTRVGMLSMSVV